MNELLYLDTARLGRMTPGARRAHHDIVELGGAEGGSAYFERFLRNGIEGLPPELRDRYPGLTGWQGIDRLKRSLRRLAGEERSDLPVLIANRSAQLMKLTAWLLFHSCRNVLVTDLDWHGYRDILAAECRRANRSLTILPVRQLVTANRIGEDEFVERVKAEFARSGCDGLFLTAVSSDGIRLPVGRIVDTLEAAHQLWFVAVDGAQDFCHAGADLRHCDLYLAGAHKWLGAYQPLGVGFYGRRRSAGVIETAVAQMTARNDLDDPLLRYCFRPDADSVGRIAETLNLAPLFSCQGAADDLLPSGGTSGEALSLRLDNWESASRAALRSDWKPIATALSLRSGILMLRPDSAAVGHHRPEVIREAFREQGVAISTYPEGLIRLSMPSARWINNEAVKLSDTLLAVNRRFGKLCGV